MKLLDGKKLSAQLFKDLKTRVEKLKSQEITPRLVFFLIGNNPASEAYVGMKEKASKKIGISSDIIRYDNNITEKQLIDHIHQLNADKSVHGMMVQLPLPKHIRLPEVIKAIDPKKDADGFHAYNFGKMALSQEFEHLPPATPLGIIRLLEAYNISLNGKHAVVVGRSNLVGKPLALMLLNRNATVSICHSKTKNPKDLCRQADIVIAATGVPELITADWIKPGAIVIDAGYAKKDGKTTGDVEFTSVSQLSSMITPVPGGVGPMTIYSIVENTIAATERQQELGLL